MSVLTLVYLLLFIANYDNFLKLWRGSTGLLIRLHLSLKSHCHATSWLTVQHFCSYFDLIANLLPWVRATQQLDLCGKIRTAMSPLPSPDVGTDSLLGTCAGCRISLRTDTNPLLLPCLHSMCSNCMPSPNHELAGRVGTEALSV